MIALDAIEASLAASADPARAVQERRYLKSDLRHLGVGLPAVRKVAVEAARGLHREETLRLADELWRAPVHERRLTAIEILIRNVRLLTAEDLPVAENLIRASHTWAYVDALAVKVVGALVGRHPSRASPSARPFATCQNTNATGCWRRTGIADRVRPIRVRSGRRDRQP